MKDRYWHIQMFLPQGAKGVKIDSSLMLKESTPVIGTMDYDDLQCKYFKGEQDGLKIGDIILVREGAHPIALCKITGDYFQSDELKEKYINDWFREVQVLDWADENERNGLFRQGTLVKLHKTSNTPSWNYINNWYIKTLLKMEQNNKKLIEILKYKKQIILQGAPGTGKTYNAKLIAKELIKNQVENEYGEQYIELIQFHPSYSYEDFVRGIVVDTDKGYPDYINKNKILGEFAKKAWENWHLNKLKEEDKASAVLTEKSKFQQFIDYIQQEIEDQGKFSLTKNVYLFEYDDTRFKYKGDNWEAHPSGLNMKYSELEKVCSSGFLERSDIKKLTNIESLTSSHSTYYTRMAEKYATFNPVSLNEDIEQAELKNYVLIIDEINRANLPAVLGELIYALEYRGESVKSMYKVDGDNTLILPPNLYIIGTMNTADRSVGQIDYAIRRRFAFVDLLPKVLSDVETFDKNLFIEVSKLFIKNIDAYVIDSSIPLERSDYLSGEFNPEDVWIGHSYFIMENSNRAMRLEYEIVPILKEYIKDGILKETAKEIITKLQ